MKIILASLIVSGSISAMAKEKVELRQPASTSQQNIICTVGDGKVNTTPKTISAGLNKTSSASIDQEIGDYRILAIWVSQINKMSIGVIEKVSGITASTLINDNLQVGSLFVSKNGQSVDLNCYIK